MKTLPTSPIEKNTLSMLQLPKTQVRSCFTSSLSPAHFPASLRVLLATPLWFISLLSSSDRLQRKRTEPSPPEMWLTGLYKPRSASSKSEMASCHFPFLPSDPEKCGMSWEKDKPPHSPATISASSPCKGGGRVPQHWLLSSCERSLQRWKVLLSENHWRGRKQPVARYQRWEGRRVMGKSYYI